MADCQRGEVMRDTETRVDAEAAAAGWREARVRWCEGAAARAYREHGAHARDLRDVPVQGLVEAAGALPGAEGEARGAEARVDAEAAAAGWREASCAMARWDSGPGLP